MMRGAKDDARAEWAQTAIEAERARITKALSFLEEICTVFGYEKYDVTVIKSLDHWPDLGSDLDLYTNANSEDVSNLLKRRFDAQVAPRSWGDRLAGKLNFIIPGLPKPWRYTWAAWDRLETGWNCLADCRTQPSSHDRPSFVSSSTVSDQLMISTLQRMYRHSIFGCATWSIQLRCRRQAPLTTGTCVLQRPVPAFGKGLQRIRDCVGLRAEVQRFWS